MDYRLVDVSCALGVLLIVSGCGSASSPDGAPQPATAAEATSSADELPPPGFGTLRQDDFTVALQSGQTQVKVTPLAEGVIRLAAPDTYQRLHGMVASRSQQIHELSERAGLRTDAQVFLVSFFTYEVQVEFRPTELQIFSLGILYRPLNILPLTPGWGREQVKQQETQSALYVFRPEIDLEVTFTVEYLNAQSVRWAQVVNVLSAERGRVLSRAKS